MTLTSIQLSEKFMIKENLRLKQEPELTLPWLKAWLLELFYKTASTSDYLVRMLKEVHFLTGMLFLLIKKHKINIFLFTTY